MLFNSLPFLLFFAVYLILHLSLPPRFRTGLIIAGSAIFYAYWDVRFFWIPHFLTALSFLGVRWVNRASSTVDRRSRGGCVILLLLLPLIYYKYFDFLFGTSRTALLPLGISFITFTVLAYVIDVARDPRREVSDFGTYWSYILFFPHLIAGPILRTADVLPQFRARYRAFAVRLFYGFVIFSVGLGKKMIFADQIGQAVSTLPLEKNFYENLLAMYGFYFQIYADFSGYTDMALGLAIILGIRLPRNFNRPFLATSPADFWRRWHISLSTWLRDYLYVPLGGNRHGPAVKYFAILVTMLLGGLYHGANWTFLVWGGVHGAAIAVAHRWGGGSPSGRGWTSAKIFITFNFIALTFILFAAPDLSTAAKRLSELFTRPAWPEAAFFSRHAFVLCAFLFLLCTHRFDTQRIVRATARRFRGGILWPVLLAIWLLSVIFGARGPVKFIYFDF